MDCDLFFKLILIDTAFLTELVNNEYERQSQQLYNSDCNSQSSSENFTPNTNLPLSSGSQESNSEAKGDN